MANFQAGGSFLPNQDVQLSGVSRVDHLRAGPTYYDASGALAPQAQNAIIRKATAALMTLAAPTAPDQDGDLLIITSQTAAAHTVTGVALLADAENVALA